MDPNGRTADEPTIADAALRAAHEAASLRPLAVRIAELETLLSVERAEHSRRLAENDTQSRSMRRALQQARSELRLLTDERDGLISEREDRARQLQLLQDRVAELRERADRAAIDGDGAMAEVVASAIGRAQAADTEVARLQRVVSTLEARLQELDGADPHAGATVVEQLNELRCELASRDVELERASAMLREKERALRETEQRMRRAEFEAVDARTRLPASESGPAAGQRDGGDVSAFPLLASPTGTVAHTVEADEGGCASNPNDPREAVDADTTITHTRSRTSTIEIGANPSPTASHTGTGSLARSESEADASSEPDVGHAAEDGGGSEPTDASDSDDGPACADAPASKGDYVDSGDASGLVVEQEVTLSQSASGTTDSCSDPGIATSVSRQVETGEQLAFADSGNAASALGHDDAFAGLRVERELARTPDMTTWRARPVDGGDPVIVRVVHAAGALPDEATLAPVRALEHPNLVGLLSNGRGTDTAHLVFECAGGERADTWVGRVGAVSARIALAVALQAARGLAAASNAGVHHGQLAPSSLWIDPSGGVRVEGVGLRAALESGEAPDALAYAAPEARSPGPIDAAADIYSLGAILYFLVTGCAALAVRPDGTSSSVSGVPDPRDVRSEVSDSVAAIVVAFTAVDPSARPGSWEAAIAMIEDAVSGRLPKPRTVTPTRAREKRRLPRLHVLVGLLAIPFALVAAVLLVQEGFTPSARERFDRTVVRAERLVRLGDKEGARALYRKFLRDNGDRSVEIEATRRLDALAD